MASPGKEASPAGAQRPRMHRRVAAVFLAITCVTAASGYFLGLRQTGSDVSPAVLPQASAATVSGAVPVARSYTQLRDDHSLQPNADWDNTLAKLAKPALQAWTAHQPTDAERAASLEKWKSRRAYDGAPPVVPHVINQDNAASCLACHGQDTEVAGKLVPRMSHPELTNCLQCHVPEGGPGLAVRLSDYGAFKANQFQGATPTRRGERAFEGAPPTIPHATQMRSDCMSCHGPGRLSAFRTSHPERQNCLQCHATSAHEESRCVGLPVGARN